jgi:ribosomal protein S18 acetylase RimI-like enzyme
MPYAFLPRLGTWFLKRAFFPLALDQKVALTLVAEGNEVILSFIVIALNKDEFSKRLKSQKLKIIFALASNFLKDPSVLKNAFQILLNTRLNLEVPIENLTGISRVVVIATDPRNRGKGVGSILICDGLALLREKRGEGSPCQVEVRSESARRFYERNGFRSIGIEHRGEENYHVLLHDII